MGQKRSYQLKTLLASLLVMSGLVCLAQEKKEKAPEPPKENAAGTARPERNGLKDLEEDLFKPLKTFSPNSSLDGVLNFPSRPVPQRAPEDKKTREKRDREKNWVFMKPEELLSAPDLQDMYDTQEAEKDGKKKQKKESAFEQYYRRTFHLDDNDSSSKGRKARKNQDASGRRPGAEELSDSESDGHDDSNLPPGLRETERALRSLSGNESSATSKESVGQKKGGLFTDIFGLGRNMPSPAEVEAKRVEKARMDEFKQILGIPVVPSTADSLNPLAGFGNPSVPAGVGSWPSASGKLLNPAPVQLGTIGNFSGGFLPLNDQSAAASLLSPAPVVDQPKPRQPTTATFTAPRRAF